MLKDSGNVESVHCFGQWRGWGGGGGQLLYACFSICVYLIVGVASYALPLYYRTVSTSDASFMYLLKEKYEENYNHYIF